MLVCSNVLWQEVSAFDSALILIQNCNKTIIHSGKEGILNNEQWASNHHRMQIFCIKFFNYFSRQNYLITKVSLHWNILINKKLYYYFLIGSFQQKKNSEIHKDSAKIYIWTDAAVSSMLHCFKIIYRNTFCSFKLNEVR